MGSYLDLSDKVASVVGAAAGVLSLVVTIVALRRQTAPADRAPGDRGVWDRLVDPALDVMLLLSTAVLGAGATVCALWAGDDDSWNDGSWVAYPLAILLVVVSILMIPVAHRGMGVRWGVAVAMSLMLAISAVAIVVMKAVG